MKTMKTTLRLPLIALAGVMIFSLSAEAAVIRVNLTNSATNNEAGFTNWVASDRSTPSSITVSGVEVFFVGSINDDEDDEIRSVSRTGTRTTDLAELTRTWWGARLKEQTSQTGPPFDSGGFLTLGISASNLGAGTFEWTSWHHDYADQNGYIDIDVSVDGGTTFVNAIEEHRIVNGSSTLAPNPATFSFTSNGVDDIHIRFTNVEVDPNTNSTIFALVNGFQIIPEPSTALLAGVFFGALLLRRHRARTC